MAIVRTSAKGQVVIPAEMRRKIGLKPGARAMVWLRNQREVVIEAVPADPIEAACGSFRDPEHPVSYVEALMQEKREEREREEKKLARLFRADRVLQPRKRVRSR